MAAGLVAAAVPSAAIAWSTVELYASVDNTLYQTEMDMPPVQNELSNGRGIFLFAGRTGLDAGFRSRRALLKFDLSDLPAGTVILDAELFLHLSKAAPGAPPSNMTLHRVLQEWGEGDSNAAGPEGQGAFAETGDATWFHSIYDHEPWRTPGGFFEPEVSSTALVGSSLGDYAWTCTSRMIEDLNAWLLHPGSNFGWLLLGFEPGAQNARRFNSREHPDPETSPRLKLTYSTPDMLVSDGFEAAVACD